MLYPQNGDRIVTSVTSLCPMYRMWMLLVHTSQVTRLTSPADRLPANSSGRLLLRKTHVPQVARSIMYYSSGVTSVLGGVRRTASEVCLPTRALTPCLVKAKFHYTGPTGPARTRTDPHGLFRETRAVWVEFRHGPDRTFPRLRPGPYRRGGRLAARWSV